MARKQPTSRVISFRMPPDLIAAIGASAKSEHVSRNKLVELLLREHLAAFMTKRKAKRAENHDVFA